MYGTPFVTGALRLACFAALPPLERPVRPLCFRSAMIYPIIALF